MDMKNGILPAGWEARLGLNGRIYYYSNHSRTVQILPPPECWRCSYSLPYGWEMGVDYENKNYYINHLTQSVTYEDPTTEEDHSIPTEQVPTNSDQKNPVPRRYEIPRDPKLGFGFIAGSEKPVVIRSVTPGGPSEGKLLPDDQIVKIDSENVMMAEREHVIERIREKEDSVVLTVLQPNRSANSSFLKPAKRATKPTDRPKVRFADDIIVNGQERPEGSSPLLLSPGVLRIHLENSQSRSFQFLPETTASDAVAALCDKLGFRDPNLFSLVLTPHDEVEQNDDKSRKSSSRSSTTSSEQAIATSSSPDSLLIAPWDCLSKVISNPSMRHHSCHFRLEFMPKDFHKLARNDPEAFKYLFQQCVNDVVSGEVYMDDLTRDEVVKLASIQMQELLHVTMPISPSLQDANAEKRRSLTETPTQRLKFKFPSLNNKVTLKYIEKEYGLRRFLPPSLLATMQADSATARHIRKSIQQHLKMLTNNLFIFGQHPGSPLIPTSPLTPLGSTESTLLQLRMQYLKILSPQHLFGGRYFSASMQALMESDITVLVGHHYGISQMINSKTKMVSVLAEFQHITCFSVAPCPAESNNTTVEIEFEEMKSLHLSMEPQAAHNLAFMVAGYCRVYGNVDMVLTLPMAESTSVPLYFGPHKVKPSHWNYSSSTVVYGASSADVYIPSDITSPSYFYCDFSEPITPAVLSQDSPKIQLAERNGTHFGTPDNGSVDPAEMTNGNSEGDYETLESLDLDVAPHNGKMKLSVLDSSDSNNNPPILDDRQDDSLYAEINTSDGRYSLPESPVSSLSTGQYSDLSPSTSPRFESRVGGKDVDSIPISNGYLIPTILSASQASTESQQSSTSGEKDWNDLMKELEMKSKGKSETEEGVDVSDVPDFLPPPPSSEEDLEEEKIREITVPPPPEERPSSENVGCSFRSDESDSGQAEESVSIAGIGHHRMSSFKPRSDELKVFSHTENDVTSVNTSVNSTTGSPLPNNSVVKSTSGIENVQDPDTRRKLLETEDLIKYFREKREQVIGGNTDQERMEMSGGGPAQITNSSFGESAETSYGSERFNSEIEAPIVTSDIASGNKRLRKAEKAAAKNRKSWAGDETLSRKLSVDGHRPISMSNPDLSQSPTRKKRTRGFFRRVFGDRKSRPHSMYNVNGSPGGSDTLDYAYRKKSNRRFRFPTPKLNLRRAFTFASIGRRSPKSSVLPSSAGASPKSHHRFRFRPFPRKSKSHGILVISEPCDNVRGVDLLPSGKYTVAGTMFQVNGSGPEPEVITLGEGDSIPNSHEDLAQGKATHDSDTTKISETIDSPTNNEKESGAEDNVKLRETTVSNSKRPFSFSTFHQPLEDSYDGIITENSGKLPFIAERRRKVESSTRHPSSSHSPKLPHLPKSLLPELASGRMPEPEVEVPTSEEPVRKRAETLPAKLSSADSFDDGIVPGMKMIRPAKPPRKLIPASNPTVPAETHKSFTLPPRMPTEEPTATSTPVQTTKRPLIKKRPSSKRRAPPPPTPVSITPRIDDSKVGDSKVEEEKPSNVSEVFETVEKESEPELTVAQREVENDWGGAAFSEDGFRSNDNSLVSEIFSYLQSSNVHAEDAGTQATSTDIPVLERTEELTTEVVQPEIDFLGEANAGSDLTLSVEERQKQIMLRMFYDEMKEDNRLTLDDDVTDDDVTDDSRSDVDSDDSRNNVGNLGSYDVNSYASQSDDENRSDDAENGTRHIENGGDAGHCLSDVVQNDDDTGDNIVANDNSDGSCEGDANSERQSLVPSEKMSENVRKAVSGDLPSYFTYQTLISPMAYEKGLGGSRPQTQVRRSSSNAKPPLPPKPIFH